MTDDEFIEVIVALREAEMALARTDSAGEAFERRRTEILDRHGVTQEDLREFVRQTAPDLARTTALWDSISHRLRTEAELVEQD